MLFLYGKDSFRSREQLKKIKEKFIAERDPQQLNMRQLVCGRTSHAEIVQAFSAAPFLAEKRLLIIESLIELAEEDTRAWIKEKIEGNAIPSWLILVIWEGTDSYKKKEQKELFARLQQEPYAQPFDVLSDIKRKAWIASRIKESGSTIQPKALDVLLRSCGEDLWQSNQVIAQLVAYAKGRDIEEKDVSLFVDPLIEDAIFALVDAIVSKKTSQALLLLYEQYALGKESGYVFAMILRQIRILLQLLDMKQHYGSISPQDAAKQLGIHPFVIKKTLPLLQNYSLEELIQQHTRLLEIDVQTKTGAGDIAVLLDAFIVSVARR